MSGLDAAPPTDAEIADMLHFPCDVERLPDGNTLITDAGDETRRGSKVIEVNPAGEIVWRYDEGLQFAHSGKRLPDGDTLITDTNNNRVLQVNRSGEITFTSDAWADDTGVLTDGTHLHYPNDAHLLDDGALIVTDRNNNRCVLVTREGEVLWQYGKDLRHPHNCDMLPNGNVLIANSDGRTVREVNRDGETVWEYGDGDRATLNWPRDADRLPNGATLITDSKNSRVIEVTPEGEIVWQFKVDRFANFYDADKLDNGNVLIADQQNKQVIEVNPLGEIVWVFRNHRPLRPISPRMKNGFFKERGADGMPVNWALFTRLAEGGGRLTWDETVQPRPCPVIEYDRGGALCLSQVIAATPGARYQMTGKIRTELAEGAIAYFQVAFMDPKGGYTGDVTQLPKGRILTGVNDWAQDTFEAVAPSSAAAAEVRVFLTGTGKVWVKDIMVFS